MASKAKRLQDRTNVPEAGDTDGRGGGRQVADVNLADVPFFIWDGYAADAGADCDSTQRAMSQRVSDRRFR